MRGGSRMKEADVHLSQTHQQSQVSDVDPAVTSSVSGARCWVELALKVKLDF